MKALQPWEVLAVAGWYAMGEKPRQIARRFGVSPDTVRRALRARGIELRRSWSAADDARLVELYPTTSTDELAASLGRSVPAVHVRARRLGIGKAPSFLAGLAEDQRLSEHGKPYRFRPGHRPANKGVRGWDSGGRSHETRFKPGQRPPNYAAIGTERVNHDGYRERKVSDTGYCPRDWRPVHLLLWEEERHGPPPAGHAVAFRNGNKQDIRLENLELVSRAEQLRRNSIHNYPAPLRDVMRLAGKLRTTINRVEAKGPRT